SPWPSATGSSRAACSGSDCGSSSARSPWPSVSGQRVLDELRQAQGAAGEAIVDDVQPFLDVGAGQGGVVVHPLLPGDAVRLVDPVDRSAGRDRGFVEV